MLVTSPQNYVFVRALGEAPRSASPLRSTIDAAPACDALAGLPPLSHSRSRAIPAAPEPAPSLLGTTRPGAPEAQRYFRTSLPIAWFTRAAQSSATPGGSAVVHFAPIDDAAAPAFR